ncbi:MAG: aldo/keto reductase [Candidatus Bathyarchaeota archaeon]|nr:aldo/keto reductase [Candidatus Bathyarchaeota archaeon]
MDKRRLGRTNLAVSQVGFGGTWIAEVPVEQAVAVVRRAFELGINYFDTARWDGDSEEKIGAALENVRGRCVIATKTGSRTKRESMDDFKVSLKNLRTDHLDILQLHGIDDQKTLRKAMGEDGSLQTCKEARREGLVDFVGITGHKPAVLAEAVASGEFDTVLVPLNVVTRQALEVLLPVAKAHDVGVVAMKPLSAKTSNLITCLYQPSLSLVSQEPELKALLGESAEAQVESLLRFALSQDIASVIPGLRSVGEVEVAAQAGANYHGLTAEEQRRFGADLTGDWCRDCAACLPCPRNINIPAALRFQDFAEIYGLKQWAQRLYGGLEVKADVCIDCGECERKCSYKLPIQKRLKKFKES